MEIKDNLSKEECKEIINTVDDVKDFFKTLVVDEGLGYSFHPDDDFNDLVRYDDDKYGIFHKGDDYYGTEEAMSHNNLMARAFEVCEKEGVDIYQIGLDTWKKYLKPLAR